MGNTISEVVGMLQDMLDKSKEDGSNDRTLYAKYKCYCDTTTDEKNTEIADAIDAIERMESELAGLRAHNGQLSQEIAHLSQSMADNEAARAEAQALRNKENEEFNTLKTDTTRGIEQLDQAIGLLSAVGADQTVTGDQTSEKLMARDATATAKGAFMAQSHSMSKIRLNDLTSDMKAALRAASVFLTGSERHKVTAFMQAPFTGNYNSQSGEIVGIIKNMRDTFAANLKTATAAENKALSEHNKIKGEQESEFSAMEKSKNDKTKTLGDNSATVTSTSEELSTTQGELATNQQFLADLKDSCAEKKKQYDHRNMLRSNEDAAIAQAISILNSDDAFATFQTEGVQTFVQLKEAKGVRHTVSQALMTKGKALHSARLQRVASAIKAENPFGKVLEMINTAITVIDEEEVEDNKKDAFCTKAQGESNTAQGDAEAEMRSLDSEIDQLKVDIETSEGNIEAAKQNLAANRESQRVATEQRANEKAAFDAADKNAKATQQLITEALKVLEDYYAFLHSHNAEKSYKKHAGVDSGGGNLERIEGASIPELEKACSAKPECVGFNSAGWLKSEIKDSGEWYDWDGGDLYEKELTAKSFVQLKDEPATWGDEMEGQRGQGNSAINMLKFIKQSSVDEQKDFTDTENDNIDSYNSAMKTLTDAEADLVADIDSYESTLAKQNKDKVQAEEDLSGETGERDTVKAYLASIKPGCDFIQANLQKRTDARTSEKGALKNAIKTLEGTPTFKAAMAAAENERLGKCVLEESDYACGENGEKRGDAACEACLEGVTVFGYCQRNPSASGCADATATSSAGALA